jgi:1-phosphofructokinase
MIVSVTPNTTLDNTLVVPTFKKHRTTRAAKTVHSLGGKPTDASWILGEMGVPSLALGFAAGAIGKKIEGMLQARGVTTDFTWVKGESRINTIIIIEDERDQDQTTITTLTLEVTPDDVDRLRTRYQQALDTASVVVIGGTLPAGIHPDFYTEFIGMPRQRGIPVVFDAAEPNLSAGLAASPTFVKPNDEELAAFAKRPVNSMQEAYEIGREIYARYGTSPILSMGSKGLLAVLPDRAYFVPPLKIEVVSAAGAGDAVLAGLAWALDAKQPIEEGLRLGVAAAAAVCLLLGTADCRREDVKRLRPQVEILPYTPS